MFFVALLLVGMALVLAVYLSLPVLRLFLAGQGRRLLEKARHSADVLHLTAEPATLWKMSPFSRQKRRKEMERQLPIIIEKIASSVRAGGGVVEAFERIGSSREGPLSQEIRHMMREVDLGIPMEEALNRLSARIALPDVSIFTAAVIIAQKSGGNIASVLETIASTIRERRTLDGKVRVLTSQGKMQGLIIGLLPVVLLGGLYLLDPHMTRPLFERPLGRVLLIAGLLLEGIGLFIIRRIVDIRY